MTRIILIRHAPTQIDPQRAPAEWALHPESTVLCQQMSVQLRPYGIRAIYASTEPKAHATGRVLGDQLDVPCAPYPDLHETGGAPFYPDHERFKQVVRRAMAEPERLIFGTETFADARRRFADALVRLTDQHRDQTIAVISHGRVLATYLGELMSESSERIWDRLHMPAYAVLNWHTQRISTIVYRIVLEEASDE
ncbi:MAG: histidine phosphatase family protein [Anaerolineae bacterium]